MKLNTKSIAVIAGLAVIIFLFAFINAKQPSGTQKADAELVDQNGNAISLRQFAGKVVFINNWASWCPPCVAEMPSIQRLKNELRDEDIVFIMVSFDEKQSKAFSFMEKRKFDFEIYFPGEKYPFLTPSIPTTYVLDKNGKIVLEHTGMASYDKPEVISQFRELVK